MNNKLISYYNKELRYLREMGEEFAEQYPKVASRLKLNENETPDPYVERLLEGIGFLTARTQLKIDSEYPRFVRRILEVVYPQFLHPVPSSTIVKLVTSDAYSANVINKLKRGHVFESLPIELSTDTLSCHYSATQDTELTPIKLESASYTSSLEYLPQLKNDKTTSLKNNQSALRLDFSVSSSSCCSELTPESLALYLGSNLVASSQLLYLLMTSCNEVVCHSFEDARQWHYSLKAQPIHKGFEKSEALVFDLNKSITSLRLLQEYIQLPEKFLFVAQQGINEALKKAENSGQLAKSSVQTEDVIIEKGVNKRVIGYEKRWFSVSFLFNKYLPDLQQLVKSDDISINTTPMVNLFKKRSVRFPIDIENTEHHVIVDRVQPLNFEVHNIEKVKGFDKHNNQKISFTPIYKSKSQGIFSDSQQNDAFFAVRREERMPSTSIKAQGGRTSYLGSEVFLSLSSLHHSVFNMDIEHLAVEAWCTNRDLPLVLSRAVESDFLVDSALPIRALHIVSAVTKPIEAVNEDQTLWSLLNQLNLSYLSLTKHSTEDSTLLIKELLLAFPHNNNKFYRSEVNSIKKLRVEPTTQVIRHKGAGSMVRGISVIITFDENLLGGIHPYLFSSVLQQYLRRSVSMNSFVEVVVETIQQGRIIEWPGLQGEKALL